MWNKTDPNEQRDWRNEWKGELCQRWFAGDDDPPFGLFSFKNR